MNIIVRNTCGGTNRIADWMLSLNAPTALDKTTLLFKIPDSRGRTKEQAKFIAAFWVRSLQKLINSLNAVGRLVNGTEPVLQLSQVLLLVKI